MNPPILLSWQRIASCRSLFSAATLALLSGSAWADMHDITNSVWRMRYGVTTDQINTPAWMADDSDHDGVINSDEIASGTNPFDAGSVVKISGITATDTTVSMTFPAQRGKQYVVQGSNNLEGFTALNPSVSLVVSSAAPNQTLTVPKTFKFFRVLVQDYDSDSDGVSDWSEYVTGYDPQNGSSNGAAADAAALTAALAMENQVSILATDSVALQPDVGNAPVDVGQVTIVRSGTLHFSDIYVPLVKSGTAQEGTDYAALPVTVKIPKNSASVVLDITPTANANLKTNRVATVAVSPGGGYTLAGPSSASVAINPAGTANGTGLTAQYHHQASTTYSTQQTIFNGVAELTQTDATIDMANSIVNVAVGNPCTITTGRPHQITVGNTATVRISGVSGGTFSSSINTTLTATSTGANTFTVPINCTVVPTVISTALVGGTNGWDTTAGPIGMSSPATGGVWSARWTGQILPQYSETYTLDFRSDDGVRLWINGQLLIDRWTTQSATSYLNTIELQAGTLYDIQIDYFTNGGTAEARLYWWSLSQVRQIVPKERLFPAPALASKFTAITSEQEAVGYVSVPFNFSVTTPNIGGTTTFALSPSSAPLPPGLTLNASTGLISGTPTTAGKYNVAINATNTAAGAITGSSVIDFTIFPTGSVTRETLVGSAITADGTIAALDDDTDYPNNTSRRLRGYLIPPKTGNYYFWLAANNRAEFWLSNNAESINMVRRCAITASTGKKIWNQSPNQMTPWLSLVAGETYYYEVQHNTGTDADDYVALGWCQDDEGVVVAVAGSPNPNGTLPSIPNGGAPRQGYPYSGTAPSYVFQPYDYPLVESSTGTLYAANLGPQGSSTTKASGSANLRVDESGNSAILHFHYSGLSTPRTAYHLHVDAFDSHPAGEIVFDIDDIDAFHPDLITEDGGYIWNFATGGTFSSIQQIRDAISLGKVYLNVHSVDYPNGEIRGTLTLVDGSQTAPDPALYAEPVATDDPTNDAHAARFLNQASFGASPADVTFVKTNGATNKFEGWIDDQLTKPNSRTANDVVAGLSADINNPYPSNLFTDAWWKYSITGQDQLRQRLAFALSEIMVVSWADNTGPLQNNARILADYYDQLVDYCLPTAGLTDSGNFRGILKQVTLTPAMGLYLDMRANQKGDISIGRHPNENYAREIMQLFSVGLNRMWDDGRFVIDGNANLIPTYSQPSIIGLSALLTGWNYAQPLQANGRLPSNFSPGADYLNPMILVPTRHENRAHKLLLNNVVSPAASGWTPRVSISSISTGNPACTVTTSSPHGLRTGDTITIAGVTGGTFTGGLTAINNSFQVTVTSGTAFTVPVVCTVAAGAAGTVTGTRVTPATYTSSGFTPVTGSQADNAGSTLPHPYDQYGLKELEAAMDNIFYNDNVPPYICRLLIQRFVTSDPSPGYIYRVVQKFKNNGSGVRGDLVAVIKQILLDGEARSSGLPHASVEERNAFGKQREPMLRLTGPARAFPGLNYTGTYTQLTGINSNRLRIVTNTPNDFNAGFSVSLNFQGNYTATSPPTPSGNPTSTTYAIASTLGIAATHNDIVSISTTGSPTTVTTSQPHGLTTGNTVTLSGVSGSVTGTAINTTQTATVVDATSFTIPINTTRAFQVASISTGNPCTITTTAAHGLTTGNSVTLNGIGGGNFSPAINGTYTVTVTGANTFTVPSNCTSPPTSYTTWRHVSNPCRVTTIGDHGLNTDDTVTISGVSGGTFSPSISGTFNVTKIDATSFTVPVNATAASAINSGTIVGANTLEVAATGMANVTYTQPAGSNVMTVSTGGPQTNIAIPSPNSAVTTLKSKVYLHVLTNRSTASIASVATGNPCTVTTTAAHGLAPGDVVTIASVSGGTFAPTINSTYTVVATPSGTQFTVLSNCTVAPTASTGTLTSAVGSAPVSGVYEVQSNPTSSSFTVTTADTPTAARTGNVIVPKISSSYTPMTSNTVVQYNNNANHNLLVGQNIWVDVPVVSSPVADGEYTVTVVTDEDHFRTSYLPVSSGLGSYAKPSGANNGITFYPLVPPPLGRSGSVVINQSTFNLGGTDATLSQSPLNSPTVFNFFFHDYKFPGTLSNLGVDSPEFQLSTDTNLSNLTNSLTNMFIGTGGANGNVNGLSSFNNGSGTVVVDIGPYMTNAKTADAGISALIDELSALLVGGPLEASTKATILNYVTRKRVITAMATGNPCTITSANHGFATGESVMITGVTGGTFSPTINNTFTATVMSANTLRVPVNCTSISGLNLTAAHMPNFPYTTPVPTATQKRDRVRAIIHLILTSAEYAVQK